MRLIHYMVQHGQNYETELNTNHTHQISLDLSPATFYYYQIKILFGCSNKELQRQQSNICYIV